MQYSVALLALAASASATAVTSLISPPGSNPSGTSNTYNGEFEITVQNVSDATIQNYAPATNCGQTGILTLLLNNGQLKDSTGRFGYIASNYQFQFDPPPGPQAGAIYTDGFSIFSNGSLAIGPNATFYECFSGKFYNLYSQSIGGQCTPVFIDIIPCAGSGGASTGTAPATAVSELSDGQPQAVTAPPVSEYTDGQPQVVTVAPVSEYSDGQPQVVQPTVVSEYSDGQPQVPTQIIAGGANSVVAQGVVALVGFLAVAIF